MPKTKKAKTNKKALTLVLTKADDRVIATLRDFVSTADSVKGAIQSGMSKFQKAYQALATVDHKKWDLVLDAARISKESSYRSTLKRAAADPEAADQKLLSTGSINRAIALLPTQAEKTKSGSTKKGGRPKKSSATRLKEQTMRCVAFLVENYEVADIIAMVKNFAAEAAGKGGAPADEVEE